MNSKIDPQTLSQEELKAVVCRTVRGAADSDVAEALLQDQFFPRPLVTVQEWSSNHFGVLILVDGRNVSITCPR